MMDAKRMAWGAASRAVRGLFRPQGWAVIPLVCALCTGAWAQMGTAPLHSFGLGRLETGAYSPDGSVIVTAGPRGIVFWDAESLEVSRIVETPGHLILDVAFSGDGSMLATAGRGGPARVWDVATGSHIHTLRGRTETFAPVAFSADGRRILTGSLGESSGPPRGAAHVWDAETGEELVAFHEHYSRPKSVALSPDGSKALTSGSSGTFLWDTGTGEVIHKISGFHDLNVAYAPDGQLLATGLGSIARLWDPETGEMIRELSAGSRGHGSISFSPDSSRIALAGGNSVAIHDTSTGALVESYTTQTTQYIPLSVVDYSPDGSKLLTIVRDTPEAFLWKDGAVRELRGHASDAAAVALSPDGSKVLTAHLAYRGPGGVPHEGAPVPDAFANVWDVETEEKVREFKQPGGVESTAVAFTPDSSRAVIGWGQTSTWLADIETGEVLHTYPLPNAVLPRSRFVEISPDGTWLLQPYSSDRVALWNLPERRMTHVLGAVPLFPSSSMFSPDSQKVAVAIWSWHVHGEGTAYTLLWDVASGDVIRLLVVPYHQEPSWGHIRRPYPTFTPDGERVFEWGTHLPLDGPVHWLRVWETETGELIRTEDAAHLRKPVFLPDGKHVLGLYGDVVGVWELESREVVRIFEWPATKALSFALSDDAERVLVGFEDGVTRLWDMGAAWEPGPTPTPTPVPTLTPPPDFVSRTEIIDTLLGFRALPTDERFFLGDRNTDAVWDAADVFLPPQ